MTLPSLLKRSHSPQERREELQRRATIPRVPQNSQSTPEEPVFPALPRLSRRGTTPPRWHVGQPCGKASRKRHRSLEPRDRNRDIAATAREESARACPHSRRGLTPLGRLQKYPKIHVSTGEESSGSDPTPHKVLGPASTGEESREAHKQFAWGLAFLRPPERVPEGPVVSREHLPQLEKIQEVLPSRRDEAHFR